MLYYGSAGDGIHLPFNFQLITLPWNAPAIGQAIERYEALLPPEGWPNWVLGNHDNPRVVSRAGPRQAKVAATLLLTLRGTPTVYYGDEIGLPDVPVPPGAIRDPLGMRQPERGRDPQRQPMRWEPGSRAGFTSGEPWLPVPDLPGIDVASQRDDPDSILGLHRRLLDLRHQEPALAVGSYRTLGRDDHVLVYRRDMPGADSFVVALNLGTGTRRLPRGEPWRGCVEVTTTGEHDARSVNEATSLGPNEGMVVRLDRVEPSA
jgi:alpha-glucosidase